MTVDYRDLGNCAHCGQNLRFCYCGGNERLEQLPASMVEASTDAEASADAEEPAQEVWADRMPWTHVLCKHPTEDEARNCAQSWGAIFVGRITPP